LLLKKSIWFEGIRDKNHQRTPRGTMARSVLFSFYTELKHALALTAIHGFFHTASLLNDLFFAYSSKK
jgi:hypothetical protein